MSGAEVMLAVSMVSTVMAGAQVIQGLKEGNLVKAALGGVSAYFAFSGLGASTALQQAAGKAGATGVSNPAAALTGTAEAGAGSVAGTTSGAGTGITNTMAEGLKGTMELGGELGMEGATSLGGDSVFGSLSGELGSQGLETATQGMVDQATGLGGDLMGLGDVGTSQFGARGGASVFGELGPSTAYKEALGQGIGELGQQGTQQATEQGLLSKAMGFAKENPELLQTGGKMLSGWAQQKKAEELREEQARMIKQARNRRGRSVGVGSTRMATGEQYRR